MGEGTGDLEEEGGLLQAVRQQVIAANVQELISKMSEKCFKTCITKPGQSLTSSENRCVCLCMDRYLESWNVVSKTYQTRLQNEHAKH